MSRTFVVSRLLKMMLGRKSFHSPRPPSPRLEVLEDRCVPTGGISITYSVPQDWGTGFQGGISVMNQSTVNYPNWTLAFDYSASISSIWDATVVSHTGNHYVIGNAGWNSTLAAGNSISFGFNASSTSGNSVQPSGYLLNGQPVNSSPPPLPTLAIANTGLNEPTTGTSNAVFTVSLSASTSAAVTAHYATSDGTAHAGLDYQATSGTVTIQPGATTGTINVPVLNDPTASGDLTFNVLLTSPSGATLGQAQAMGTIHDPVPGSAGTAQFSDDSDWGTGFNGTIKVTNTTSSTLTNWTLAFTFGGQISSIWNGTIVSQNGSHYVVEGTSWNNTIAPASSTSFGFSASPGNVTPGTSPTGFVLSGQSSGGGSSGGGSSGGSSGGTTSQPPVTPSENSWTYLNQAVVINVLAGVMDPNNSALSVSAITAAQHGTAVLNSNGTVTYTPTTGYLGTDSFNYTVKDALGLTASGSVSITVANPTTSPWPTHYFAPYVDMTAWPTYDLVSAAKNESIHYFTLAFVVADASNNSTPSWGGFSSNDVNGGAFDQQVRTEIAGVRALGGDVIVSFGGAANSELATVVTNVTTLTADYQSVINAYQLTHIDFDIEGAAVANNASIDRRNQALAALQQSAAGAGRTLDISYTLPVLPTGLTANGLYVLQSAQKYGVKLSIVNVMAMDYGDSAAPNPKGQMGTYAIESATSLFNQLQGLYGNTLSTAQLWHMVGVTPMIGVNDASDEVFDQAAAQQLLAFAEQKGIGEIAMWSLNRDQQDPSGALNYASSSSSSILQTPYQFSLIFNGFNG